MSSKLKRSKHEKTDWWFFSITKACKPVLVVIQNQNMNLKMSIVWLLYDDVTFVAVCKQVFLHLGNMIERPGHLYNTTVLHYNAV